MNSPIFELKFMSPNEEKNLAHLMGVYGVTDLGEGDPVVGANLLAAMAITLGDLARRGSGIKVGHNRVIPVGCNLLVCGARSTQLVVDEITTMVARAQSNIFGQIRNLAERKRKEEIRLGRFDGISDRPDRVFIDEGFNRGEVSLNEILSSPSEGAYAPRGDLEQDWANVISCLPSVKLEELQKNSRAFITAATPAQLGQMLQEAHLGEAMVSLGLTSSKQAACMGTLCDALMDGLLPIGHSGGAVRGRLLVMDSSRLLNQTITGNSDNFAWLGRLIWLSDDPVGPAFPEPAIHGKHSGLQDTTTRFEKAVLKVLSNRMNHHNPKPLVIEQSEKGEFMSAQGRWMEFLASMEPSILNISGTGRTLFTSLIFGLWMLRNVLPLPPNFRATLLGTETYARLLVRRMANTRAAMLYSSEDARKLRRRSKTLEMLTDGPMDARSLYRRLHVSASDCDELLTEMQSNGLVKLIDQKWALQEGSSLVENSSTSPPIEV